MRKAIKNIDLNGEDIPGETLFMNACIKWLGTAQPRRFLGKNKSVNFSFRYHV